MAPSITCQHVTHLVLSFCGALEERREQRDKSNIRVGRSTFWHYTRTNRTEAKHRGQDPREKKRGEYASVKLPHCGSNPAESMDMLSNIDWCGCLQATAVHRRAVRPLNAIKTWIRYTQRTPAIFARIESIGREGTGTENIRLQGAHCALSRDCCDKRRDSVPCSPILTFGVASSGCRLGLTVLPDLSCPEVAERALLTSIVNKKAADGQIVRDANSKTKENTQRLLLRASRGLMMKRL